MKLYSQNKYYKLYNGNMLDMCEVIEQESIDSIVTDPPYELNFMNKGWDNSGIAFQKETWKKCYEVLKPGGYLLAFGGSRTFHRIACAIEVAGFEVRDVIMWLYGSGFPKSMNIGLAIDKKNGVERKIVGYAKTSMPDFRDVGEKQKEISGVDKLSFGQIENSARKQQPIYEAQNQWSGWGTALKPAFEPVIVARKPFKGSCVDNVLKYGVGGVNIDECRIQTTDDLSIHKQSAAAAKSKGIYGDSTERRESYKTPGQENGRFPSNVIFTYDDNDFEEVCCGLPNGGKNGSISKRYKMNNQVYGEYGECNTWDAYNDSGSAARYFYCAKASTRDRDEGLENMLSQKCNDGRNTPIDNAFQRGETLRKNTHPTVKPTDLMQYLVRLVTPNGGVVLDPFNGSGSTGKAVMWENRDHNKDYKYIGIEMTEEYLPIAKARIEYVLDDDKQEIDKVEIVGESGQLTFF